MNLTSDPINSPKDDYLNRKKHIDYIFRLIKDSHNRPLRIGIFGPWGCGKSSIVDTLESEHLDKGAYTMVRFDPWVYSSEDDLINGFNTDVYINFQSMIDGPNAGMKKSVGIFEKFRKKVKVDVEKLGSYGVAAGQITNFLKSIFINKNAVKELIKKNNKKVIFVIEDIDRCKPEVIRPFLLYVREILNIENVITIFVSDLSVMNLTF